MKIRWTLAALRDLEKTAEYIANEDEQAARLVVQRIRQSIQTLQVFPNSGRYGLEEGTRELIVRGTSYIVPYRIQEHDDEIQILRILHSSQKRP